MMCSWLITFCCFIQILVRSSSWGTLTSVEIRGIINDCLHSRASSTVANTYGKSENLLTFKK